MAPTPSKTVAAEIFAELGLTFDLPTVTLTDVRYNLPGEANNPIYTTAVEKLEINSLTDGTVEGAGDFDKIMTSVKAHIAEQFEMGRLSGDQYVKAYIELTGLAMSTALQFVMSREASYWQNVTAKEQAKRAEADTVTARIMAETAKAQLATARYQAALGEAQYVLTLEQIASEDAKYQLTWAQFDLTKEQIEVQRAQTNDTRTEGTAVAGTLKRQWDLLGKQAEAFDRDADARVGKMYLDGFLTQKTIIETIDPPNELTTPLIPAYSRKLVGLVAFF